MTREGGPGSGPSKDGLSSRDSLKVGAHLTYNQGDPKNRAGIKFDKPSTYPKPPGRMQSQSEKMLPFSSGQPHISTYPVGAAGVLKPKPSPTSEADSDRTGSAWNDMPKGWTPDSRDEYAKSMAQNKEGPVSNCMDKIGSHVSDPGAFCASLHDRVTGTTKWRGKQAGILLPKMSKEADGGSNFPQALRAQNNES